MPSGYPAGAEANLSPYSWTEPRVCVFSQRNAQRLVARCADYEFEDVICQIDDAELLAPHAKRLLKIGQKCTNRLARHFSVVSVNPGLAKVKLRRNYDLFFAKCLFASDLSSLNAVEGWRQRCKIAVCWLAEIWAGELDKWKGHLKILSHFDLVVLNCHASVKPIQNAISRPCFYMAPAIDAVSFCPYPTTPHRCIDVYSLGRKSPVTHQSLLKMVRQKQIFYIYDTIDRLETSYPKQHRNLMANIAKRSRYFIANAAKMDRQFETHGQSEIGYRFTEGAAAGAILIGEPPDTDIFRKQFDWPGAVVRIPFDAPDIDKILTKLDSQPERLEQIRKNNIIQCLLRHDWVYRWQVILKMVGLKPRQALLARQKLLQELAAQAG